VTAFFVVVSKADQDSAVLERGKPLMETGGAWLGITDGAGRAADTSQDAMNGASPELRP